MAPSPVIRAKSLAVAPERLTLPALAPEELYHLSVVQASNLNFAVAADRIDDLQERDAGRDSIGALTLGGNEKILGAWSCFDPVGGQNWDMNFSANGYLLIQMGARRGQVPYHMHDGLVSFQLPDRRFDDHVEEISADKLVLRYAGQRVACVRR